jgi:hypothetical protein
MATLLRGLLGAATSRENGAYDGSESECQIFVLKLHKSPSETLRDVTNSLW